MDNKIQEKHSFGSNVVKYRSWPSFGFGVDSDPIRYSSAEALREDTLDQYVSLSIRGNLSFKANQKEFPVEDHIEKMPESLFLKFTEV